MTEYAAGKYTITGPAVWAGDDTPSHKFMTGDVVELLTSRTPDEDGDLNVRRLDGSLSGYIVATSLTPLAPKASDFKVGDLVTVSAEAKTSVGSSVYFAKECEAKVIAGSYGGDVHVEATDGTTAYGRKDQHVGPAYLTMREAAAEEPEAPVEEEETPDTVAVLALIEALGFLDVDEDTVSKAITLARLIEKGV